ncbi:hypothetical protein Poli38472_014095 [Pythium oligandrum]|uniref:Uncharacterized protein n=1 Tax=Pythium oligandrum TaxID=41045 RepID=A0A8K1CPS9_PYTOL|nr:hypothetical protein Poli38472_014095 [Pythium oligandrum]|eukprot:TMW66783.1 hypothetical protein Poli38472_014095 [Pythium oligandrum]
MLLRLLEKLPLSQSGKVAVGTGLCLGICAIPVSRRTKAGHDLFSSEKPQDVYDAEIERRRAQLDTKEA